MWYKKLLLAPFSFGLAFSGFSMPTGEKTNLPAPPLSQLQEQDKPLLAEALNLGVFKDSLNSKQFYYIPPFHVRQYAEGAATMMLHVRQLEFYGEINALLSKKENASEKVIGELRDKVEKVENELNSAEKRLEDALMAGNEKLVAYLETVIERHRNSLEKAEKRLLDAEDAFRDGESLIPEGMRKEIDQALVTRLNRAGFEVNYNDALPAKEMQTEINKAIRLFESAYGGYLSFNAYAGFSAEQLASLRLYLNKYFPDIKVTLLAMDKFTFGSLTELKSNDSTSGTKIYRQINGSGDYLGATIALDSTITGSFAVAQHLGPHVMPIKIEGEFKYTPPPTEAELDCDFSAGWEIYGRTDVMDGGIIYDDDVYTDLTATDSSSHFCSINIISGDIKSAQLVSIQELQKKLEDFGLERIKLSQADKENYYAKIMQDIDDHRRPAGRYQDYYEIWKIGGWDDLAIMVLSDSSDFYWHTSVQNVSKLSTLKFKKKISINGYDHMKKDISTDLCLVYNSEIQAYDRCSPEEQRKAKTLQQSSKEAQESPPCIGVTSPVQCGQNRDRVQPIPPQGNRNGGRDTYLPASVS